MKLSDVKRAEQMRQALEDLGAVRKDCARTVPKDGYDQRGICIGTWDYDGNGGSGGADLYLPIEAAPALLEFIERWLSDELTKLGVTP